MNPETLLDALQYIDDDLIARAEAPAQGSKVRPFPRRLAALAACLTLALGITAVAAGALGPLLSYFEDPSGLYLEDFLAAGTSVADQELELRLEGAIADSRSCYLVVSFLGRTEEVRKELDREKMDPRSDLSLSAVTTAGEDLAFSTTTMGTYTDGSRQAVSYFEDADLTYVITGTLPQGTSMEDLAVVTLTSRGLTLEAAPGDFLCPEYSLLPDPAESAPPVTDLQVSAIGFSYVTAAEEPFLDLRPIYTDGTVYETFSEDYGISAGGEWEETGPRLITGHWASGSAVGLAVLDLSQYQGFQVDGVNYYFVPQ